MATKNQQAPARPAPAKPAPPKPAPPAPPAAKPAGPAPRLSDPKPASPPPPPPATMAASDEVDIDTDDLDDSDDLDGGASNGAKGSWKDTMKLPPAKRVAVRIGNLVDRVQHQLDAMKSWTGEEQEAARNIIVQVQQGLKDAAEKLARVPDSWRPARSAAGGGSKTTELKPDDIIMITEKRRSEYEGVLPDDHMFGIKVLEVRGNRVVTLTKDGMRSMFPRGHVCLDTTAKAS